jgi:protein SCO1/2
MRRRNLVMSLAAAGAGVLVARPGSGISIASLQDPDRTKFSADCARPLNGPYSYHIPNVVVHSHDDRNALFYNDLVRGKTVIINCMSTRNETDFPVTANLAKVQRLFGNRLGRDLFMYSITVDPEHDTPRVLKAFAEKYQARPGWTFLTGESAVTQLLRSRLFVSDGVHSHDHDGKQVEDCSLALIKYGNEAVGLWGSVPAKSNPASIAMRLSWIESSQAATHTVTRGGPAPLIASHSFSRGAK